MSCTDCKKKDKCSLNIGRGCCFCETNGTEDPNVLVCEGAQKLHVTDWLKELPNVYESDIFEVRFKNTRKGYYKNVNDLPLKQGDVVAVEASPGHDIGIVSLMGDMVARQMKRVGFNPQNGEFKKIYRKVKPYDVEKWQEAIALEHPTMIKSRQIAVELGLNMKIGDVEYQGDRVKAIFYYIADERVDFRELIKILADEFKVRIEMKQIGARQEAGRIGGLGSCGRELCCASWISSFVSVTTNSARYQEISLNPQKLAGQCGKLKCCLIYELDSYLDVRKDFPRINAPLEALDGSYHLIKTDIFKRTMWFSSDPHAAVSVTPVSVDRVKEIIALNRKGVKVDQLVEEQLDEADVDVPPDYANVVGEDSITRFDTTGKNRRKDTRHRRDGRRPQSIEQGPVSETLAGGSSDVLANRESRVGQRNDRSGNRRGDSRNRGNISGRPAGVRTIPNAGSEQPREKAALREGNVLRRTQNNTAENQSRRDVDTANGSLVRRNSEDGIVAGNIVENVVENGENQRRSGGSDGGNANRNPNPNPNPNRNRTNNRRNRPPRAAGVEPKPNTEGPKEGNSNA